MAAKIDLAKQGIKGCKFHHSQEGYINVRIDENESNRITFDAFTGAGLSYKRMDESIINIFNDFEPIFREHFKILWIY